MIHFDFILTDEEAENLFDAVSQQISESHYAIFFGAAEHKEWHRNRVLFLQKLQEKMTNKNIS